MNKYSWLPLLTVAFWISSASSARADIIEFFLTGNGGEGLLGANISPPPTNPGSGAMGPGGITYDTDTNSLSIDIAWGSANGFTDMSGTVTMLHLHGPTASSAPDAWSEVTTDILINLGQSGNFDDSASSGGLNASFFLSSTDAQFLVEGRAYINVHTALNDTGEIRGYLLAVPEPGGTGLLMLVAASAGIVNRRRRQPAPVARR